MWISKKRSLIIRGESGQLEYSAPREYEGEVKPALFFLESTFQIILNEKDGPLWKVSAGVISREQWL